MVDHEQIQEELHSIIQYVNSYCSYYLYSDWDYGYHYELDVWEAIFFDENDEVAENVVASTKEELIQKLIIK